jgi:hypothetical protein
MLCKNISLTKSILSKFYLFPKTYIKINTYLEFPKINIHTKRMEQIPSRLSTQKDEEDLMKVVEDLKIQDKNMPDVPKKPVRVTSFGGRIRISALVAPDADKWIDKKITVGGWARTLRVQGGGDFAFIDLNDGSTIKNIQIIVMKELPNYTHVIKEGNGSCFQIRGTVVKSPGSKQPVRIFKYNILD